MDYCKDIGALGLQRPGLAAELAPFRTIESVMEWMKKRRISLANVDIIFQDEYSHDFLIPIEPDAQYLAFGVT